MACEPRSDRVFSICVLALLLASFPLVFCWGEGIGIAPKVEIAADGNATVTWDTGHRCTGANVAFGIAFGDDPFSLPYYRLRVSATVSARTHAAQVALKDIEKIARGTPFNGKVFYRATCFDLSSTKYLDSGDCVFRYVKEGDSYRRNAAIVEGPLVANVTSSSVVVRWVTDVPSQGRVRLAEKSISAEGPGRDHEVQVGGLKPHTAYAYQLEVWTGEHDGWRTRPYSFQTAPETGSDDPFSFAVFSDTRAHEYSPVSIQALNGVNADVLRQIAVGALQKGARFAVVVGDLISGVTNDTHRVELELRSWKKAVAPVAHYLPFYTAIGNHDVEVYDERAIGGKKLRVRKTGKESAEEIFRREMTNPTNGPGLPEKSDDPTYCENVYSFDYGSSHFVVLNNDYKVIRGASDDLEKGKIIGQQLAWLKQDLEAATARGQKNIFAFFHEPAFPNGGHLGDSMYSNGDKAYVGPRDEFWRVLCAHKVVAVFCGHEHNYSRALVDETVSATFSHPIWQIVTGGGGAPFHPQDRPPWRENVKLFSSRQNYCIVRVAGGKVRLSVYDPPGNLIEEADLR
jgi:hypothetical protein